MALNDEVVAQIIDDLLCLRYTTEETGAELTEFQKGYNVGMATGAAKLTLVIEGEEVKRGSAASE